MISSISRKVTALATSRKSGSAMADGAHVGSRVYIPLPWPPLWLIWARIFAPSRCTRVVMRW